MDAHGKVVNDAMVKQNENIIRMVEMPVDPLEPPKFKHQRVPKALGSPSVTVMHSPPKPVTVKNQQDGKIPPCISNWKNPKGYIIPFDKCLAADGRGLQEVQINDDFVKLYEALCVSEQKGREAVAMRSKVQESKEQEPMALDQKARPEGTSVAPPAAAAVFLASNKSGVDDGDMQVQLSGKSCHLYSMVVLFELHNMLYIINNKAAMMLCLLLALMFA